MNDVEERARLLIQAARAGHDPHATDAARVRTRLKARVLAEPLLIQPSPAAGAGASRALGKVLIALGVGSSLGFAAGLYAARAFWPGALARPVEMGMTAGAPSATGAGATNDAIPPEGAVTLSPDATERAESPVPAAPRSASRASSSPRASSGLPASVAPLPNPLKAELDGLRRAQELLHQGRPAWAIARLDELDRAGVGSVLLEERAATRAIAECGLGADGSSKAEEYARHFPRSPHLERVRSSCAGAPQSGTPGPTGGTPAGKVMRTPTESRGSPHE